MTRPTEETYGGLQQAYDFFNGALFGDSLPACLITVQRHRQTFGYFSDNRSQNRQGEAITDEITPNAAWFSLRSVEETLSTLAHEMTHLWHDHHSAPGRGRYHNVEWADNWIGSTCTGLPAMTRHSSLEARVPGPLPKIWPWKRCALSGASMPAIRTRSPRTTIVSPSITCGRPDRTASRPRRRSQATARHSAIARTAIAASCAPERLVNMTGRNAALRGCAWR